MFWRLTVSSFSGKNRIGVGKGGIPALWGPLDKAFLLQESPLLLFCFYPKMETASLQNAVITRNLNFQM
jgi:hypothetical protein